MTVSARRAADSPDCTGVVTFHDGNSKTSVGSRSNMPEGCALRSHVDRVQERDASADPAPAGSAGIAPARLAVRHVTASRLGDIRIDPATVPVGRASVIYVEGTCLTERRAGCNIELRLRHVEARAILSAVGARQRRFSATLSLGPATPVGRYEVIAVVAQRLRAPQVVSVGCVEVVDEPVPLTAIPIPAEPDDEPLVAVCMATHEPSPGLFDRQVASIREQTHRRFVCIVCDDRSSPATWERIVRAVGDDERFVCVRQTDHLGFYRNFERCLRLVPLQASFVALADQDDVWHRDKLAVLVGTLDRESARLVYSDMNVVSAEGLVISPTYWRERQNNFTDLASLLLMNTVTGASCLFTRAVLDDALPFPPEVGRAFHDHWLACVALAGGEIGYLDRPLHDYVQHESNVAGTFTPSDDFKGGAAHALMRFIASPRVRFRSAVRHAGTTYREELFRLEVFARTLELRLGGRLEPARSTVVRRAATVSMSGRSFLWLLERTLRDVSGRNATLGVENQLLKAIVWSRLSRWVAPGLAQH